MSPSSKEISGHTGQELRVSLEFFSLEVLRFVVAHWRPPDYATCTCAENPVFESVQESVKVCTTGIPGEPFMRSILCH